MTRSKLSSKVLLLVGGIGLSMAAFAGSLPAAAQSYTCPDGLAYDPSYGCTLRNCQEIIESTFDRANYGFTTIVSHHMLWW